MRVGKRSEGRQGGNWVQINYYGVTLTRSPEIGQERLHCGGGGEQLAEQNSGLGWERELEPSSFPSVLLPRLLHVGVVPLFESACENQGLPLWGLLLALEISLSCRSINHILLLFYSKPSSSSLIIVICAIAFYL